MENQSAFESFEMHLTNEAQGFLRETAKWATFLSILGFILIGIFALVGLGSLASGASVSRSVMPIPASLIGIIYILSALLYFFPVLYLYKFASAAKDAIASQNTQTLTRCFENLKSHYKFVGILTIIMIILWIVGAIVMATFLASAMGGRM